MLRACVVPLNYHTSPEIYTQILPQTGHETTLSVFLQGITMDLELADDFIAQWNTFCDAHALYSRRAVNILKVSEYFGVSLIEGTLSFTSFLYFISWFPLRVQVHSWSVWEAVSRQCVHHNLSHYIQRLKSCVNKLTECWTSRGVSQRVSKFQSNEVIIFIWVQTQAQFDISKKLSVCVYKELYQITHLFVRHYGRNNL